MQMGLVRPPLRYAVLHTPASLRMRAEGSHEGFA
jgi:hypothetical protein